MRVGVGARRDQVPSAPGPWAEATAGRHGVCPTVRPGTAHEGSRTWSCPQILAERFWTTGLSEHACRHEHLPAPLARLD